LRIDGRDTIPALLPDQDPPIRLHDDPLGHRHAAGDALDRTVGLQRSDGSSFDVAEEQAAVVVEGEIIGRRLIPK
jgi:hypothetical protein